MSASVQWRLSCAAIQKLRVISSAFCPDRGLMIQSNGFGRLSRVSTTGRTSCDSPAYLMKPERNSGSGERTLPKGACGLHMSKDAVTLAMTSHMLLSLRKRPGQILPFNVIWKTLVSGILVCGEITMTYCRPCPKMYLRGSHSSSSLE